MKKILVALLAIVAAVAVLAGCSGGGASSGSTDSSNSADASGSSAAASSGGVSAEADASSDIIPLKASLPSGSLALPEIQEPQEMNAEQVEEAERAIRAYTPSKSGTLHVNKAKSFYYYEKIDKNSQVIYDALLQLLENPTDDSAIFSATLSAGTSPSMVKNDYALARLAVQYDHPELFWIYNDVRTDIETGFTSDGSKFYMNLEKPYKNYEKEMKAFNDAVDEFLSDIDTTKSDAEVALAIHDKLIDTVEYDSDVANKKEAVDFAHTAYGALVENSSGDSNTAVCDGYSQAYVYLLQQCGIDAAVVLGYAGDTKSNAGGHAWNVVNLDGDWYEVDATWDDSEEEWKAALEDAKKEDPKNEAIPYYEEMIGDGEYMGKVQHCLYNLTTKQIEAFKPSRDLYYEFKDGKTATLLSESVHVREQDAASGSAAMAALMELAPTATGTKHAFAA